jgi:hypothetical protein
MKTKELIAFLLTQDDEIEWVYEKKESKLWRSLAQNRTYWKIFKWIWDKLGYKKETVRTNILTALFWTYECKMFWIIHLVPNKTSTTELDREEAIKVIDASLAYAKKIDAWIEITPKEIQDLYNNY